MAITEDSRHRLYTKLEQLLGTEQATTLMEHLPPVGWADVATRSDLHTLRSELGADITDLRREMEVGFTDLRRDMEVGFTDLRRDMEGLRRDMEIGSVEVRRDMEVGSAGLRAEIAEARAEVQRDLRTQMFAIIGGNVGLLGAAMALGRFF